MPLRMLLLQVLFTQFYSFLLLSASSGQQHRGWRQLLNWWLFQSVVPRVAAIAPENFFEIHVLILHPRITGLNQVIYNAKPLAKSDFSWELPIEQLTQGNILLRFLRIGFYSHFFPFLKSYQPLEESDLHILPSYRTPVICAGLDIWPLHPCSSSSSSFLADGQENSKWHYIRPTFTYLILEYVRFGSHFTLSIEYIPIRLNV